MSTAALSIIARLREAGATLECKDGGRVRFSAPAPLPAALLAEAREHREAIAAALNADAHKPPGAGGVVISWGLTAEERTAALARLRPQRGQAIAAVVTSDALRAAPQDGSPDSLPPVAAPALLAYIRDRLRCRVTLAGNLVMIAPTWRCPPRIVEAAQKVAPQLRDLLQTEGVPISL